MFKKATKTSSRVSKSKYFCAQYLVQSAIPLDVSSPHNLAIIANALANEYRTAHV
jgi:hypothetical protein